MWNHDDGIVRSLLARTESLSCASPSLKESLRSIKTKYEVLEHFTQSSETPDVSKFPIKPGVARRKLTNALMEFRKAILTDLKTMEKELKKKKGKRRPKLGDEVATDTLGTAEKANQNGIDTVDATTQNAEGRKSSSEQNGLISQHSELGTDDTCVPQIPVVDSQKTVESEVAAVLEDLLEKVIRRVNSPPLDDENTEPKIAANNPHDGEEPRPWLEFYYNRDILQTAADLILMYAKTSTFFLLRPYKSLDSTPIEVYARELGNSVPRSVIDSSVIQKFDKEIPPTDCATDLQKERESSTSTSTPSKSKKKSTKESESLSEQDVCQPDDIVAEVKIKYQGDFVVSQLLQWYNGGIGLAPGLPDMLGCVCLPSISGCFDGIPKMTAKAKKEKLTVYEREVRPKLIQWFNDPHQRGSPWNEDIRKSFTSETSESFSVGTSFFGSPVLDLLVIGDDAAINSILEEFGAEDSKSSQSTGLLSTVDQGRPAQAVSNWVQCESCSKWRKVPFHVDIDVLAKSFVCADNKWNRSSNSCEAPEVLLACVSLCPNLLRQKLTIIIVYY